MLSVTSMASLQDIGLQTLALPVLTLSLLLWAIYRWSTATDIAKIKGIPEIPGALPIVGHLLQLGEDHATVCEVSLLYQCL